MKNNPPKNKCTCETNKHWIGRNLLRNAMLTREGRPRSMKAVNGSQDLKPLFWLIESPETFRRAEFSVDAAERAAKPVRAFLEDNGVKVTSKPVSLGKDWEKRKLVRVFADKASEPATIAMLPVMQDTIWGLVRFDNEPTSYSKALPVPLRN